MNPETYPLRIPHPCTADWNSMNPVDGGRFCAQCQKKVHDLSEKSGAEIKAWIPTHETLPCVRVKQPVWNTSITRKTLPKWAKTFIIALLTAFGFLASSPKVNGQTTFNFSHQQIGKTMLRVQLTEKRNGDPMMYVTVLVKKDGIILNGANTDEDGVCEILLPDAGAYLMEVRSPGDTFSRQFQIKNGEMVTINALYEEVHFGGDSIPVYRESPFFDVNQTTYDQQDINEKGR